MEKVDFRTLPEAQRELIRITGKRGMKKYEMPDHLKLDFALWTHRASSVWLL